MLNFVDKLASEAIFSARLGEEVSDLNKIKLLKRVCRL